MGFGFKLCRARAARSTPFRTFKAYQRGMSDFVMRFLSISLLTLIGLFVVGSDSFASASDVAPDSTMLHMSNQEVFVEGSILMEEGFWHEKSLDLEHGLNTLEIDSLYTGKIPLKQCDGVRIFRPAKARVVHVDRERVIESSSSSWNWQACSSAQDL